MKYKLTSRTTRQSGEWFHVQRSGHILVCCDCGLAHFIQPKVLRGRVYLKTVRLKKIRGGYEEDV